ncbi:DUF6600 domain-containing protein [Janthinobacterium agaricidamnosum]|uniref:Putative transmembrane protein n=1 Tax=Janthinobacterium agaricidamnosum NBRC 102515 = DSM 9628 TaxID=1349767 RepID=W0VB65_9BURK|nr:DUF6600 domain-containing protein [Janthinobacterium agaricidamnosum]CDG86044.1 putative transmembrane protein [Janthinobacterium agaricidamnosum NBRC 102515 = DSM 9628]
MRPTLLNALATLLLASITSLALADPPARVGRISATDGLVVLQTTEGEYIDSGLLNWPLTTGNRISTMRGGGAEFRLGSSAVRLSGDAELEVSQLDDDHFKLRLLHGSASVRLRNPQALPGFALDTPQARIRLQQPGWVRIDADRPLGTTVLGVLEGVAEIDGPGDTLTVRAGKRVELTDDDVRIGLLQRDAFDNWPELALAGAPALSYVSEDTTGYEELDRYGSWQNDADYGPLWLPRSLPAGWAPYSDGRWTWVAPWGWTWVDNAPWGYAPFHYGRWVMVGQRWWWSPGRGRQRPVWAPALVGWVGGNPHGGHGPSVGWFPLSPRERYVPGYRVSADYQRRINSDGRWTGNGGQRERRDGLIVLPQDQFGQRRTVQVGSNTPATLPPAQIHHVPLAPLPAAPQPGNWQRPNGDEAPRRPDWNQARDWPRRAAQTLATDSPGRPPIPALPATPPLPAIPAMPALPRAAPDLEREHWREQRLYQQQREQRAWQERERQEYPRRRDGRIETGSMPALPPVIMPRAPAVVVVPAQPSQASPPPQPQQQPQPPRREDGRRERGDRGEGNGPRRGNNAEMLR